MAQEPLPVSDVTWQSPPRLRTIVRTASMPTPRPEMSVVSEAVEKPGSKSSSMASSTLRLAASSGADQAALDGDLADLLGRRCRGRRRGRG